MDRIALLAGVSRMSTLRGVLDPRRERVRTLTERKILSVPVPAGWVPTDECSRRVPLAGTQRRLRALVAAGYRQDDLASRLGVAWQTVSMAVNGNRLYVLADFAIATQELFEELEFTPGGDTRSINWATKRGWVPPLAWDPETIDDPTAMPDAKINVYASTRRLRALCRMGFSQKYMSERLDIPTDKTSEILRFLGPIDYSLADAIEKLFNELRDTPKDDERLTSRRAAQARSVTARYGWAFPDDLGDVFKKPSKQEIESMNRSNNERADTAKKMFSEGVSKSEIARRMNVNPTTVYAWLREAA